MKKHSRTCILIIKNIPYILNIYSCRMIAVLFLILFESENLELKAQRISRDLNVDLLVNQVGYVPHAGKTIITKGVVTERFDITDLVTRKVVYSGSFKPHPGDFGAYSVGDFSALTKEGHYYVRCDTLRSYPFKISAAAYRQAMNLIVEYFSLQRCGSSTTGYLSPCHLDDGVRMDNGRHQDVTGVLDTNGCFYVMADGRNI